MSSEANVQCFLVQGDVMKTFTILFWVALLSPCDARTTGWIGIVPLHSTRADVERLLGPPIRSCQDGCTYNTKNESVSVHYSGRPCEEGDQNRWHVPPGTVIGLSVYPAVKPKLSDLKLKLKKFVKTNDPELRGYLRYSNDQDGVTYEVSDEGLVLGIEWFPGLRDDALRCSDKR
jgi:hypothetical protein